MDSELTKLAHAAIKQLQQENIELITQLTRKEEAVKIAFELYHNGQLAAEQLEDKIKEYSALLPGDLEVIKKASELTKVASTISSFKLSSRHSFENTTPEDRFTSFLLEDL
jgi:hypothetical protein